MLSADMDGWTELTEDEDDLYWETVYGEFDFRPTVDHDKMPSFDEPFDSMTWRIDTDDPVRAEELVRPALGAALVRAAAGDANLIALDWQHTSYHVDVATLTTSPWLIPAVPNGDYSLLLARDLRFGWLGHPWEPSVCVYGDLLPLVRPLLQELGWTVLRRGGRRRHLRLV